MKILISITQNVDATKKIIATLYKDLGISTEAGPFKTREEALNWQDFMMKRKDNYEEIKTPVASTSEAYWFGVTIESPNTH